VNHSAGGTPQTSEEVKVPNPAAGDYIVHVDNWAAPDPRWRGTVTFTPATSGSGGVPSGTGTGAFTVAQRDNWFAKVRHWVSRGGNLVLTDGALRALPELVPMPKNTIRRTTVYAGGIAFSDADANDDTLHDPLAADLSQDGARWGSGWRRQMYEPTPLGFSIQDPNTGADQSHAQQWDIDKAAFKAAGGRVTGSGVDAGARNAKPVFNRVTLGEIHIGTGKIRVAGALLPQPTEEYDHTLGLEPYAVTYSGYILIHNLLTP
jgi:hypothetical protein